MKKFSLGLIAGALIALVISSSIAQQPPRVTTKEFQMDPNDPTDVTPVSPNWKRISEDVAIRLYTDSLGMPRARLEVRVDKRWRPVAVDGPEAFLPPAVPAR